MSLVFPKHKLLQRGSGPHRDPIRAADHPLVFLKHKVASDDGRG